MQRVRVSELIDSPTLVTARLRLRPLRLDDAPAMFSYAADPEVARYTRWSAVGHQTIDDTLAFLQDAVAAYAAGRVAPWAIVTHDSDRVIGTCGFVQARPQHRWAELAYALARPCWGQGLITEAACAVLEHGFSAMDLMRVQATCYSSHHASMRVMEKLGMSLEGVLRQCVYTNHAFHDLAVYSILRPEWQAQQEAAALITLPVLHAAVR